MILAIFWVFFENVRTDFQTSALPLSYLAIKKDYVSRAGVSSGVVFPSS